MTFSIRTSGYYKLDITRKTLLGPLRIGFRRVLPPNVRAADLVKAAVTDELTIHCQRPVKGLMTVHNGAWLILDRTGSTSTLPDYVTLGSLLQYYDPDRRDRFPILLGVQEGRKLCQAYLAEQPHFLIAGSTGTGKSNLLNTILSVLVQKHSPDELRLVLIDLKEGAELARFKAVPQLALPVVTELTDTLRVLEALEALRADRSRLIGQAGLDTLEAYNRQAAAPLPRIVVIFDEFASLLADRKLEVAAKRLVVQLMQKSRAAGITLFLCTQHPSVQVIANAIKVNATFRVAGRTLGAAASRTILDVGDADRLPAIAGRMLARSGPDLWPLQTPHARSEDIRRAVDLASRWPSPAPLLALDTTSPAAAPALTDIVRLALERNHGKLTGGWVYKIIDGLTRAEAYDLVRQIAGQSQWMVDGRAYLPVRQRGNFLILQPQLPDKETS